jgi:hypothetical protein
VAVAAAEPFFDIAEAFAGEARGTEEAGDADFAALAATEGRFFEFAEAFSGAAEGEADAAAGAGFAGEALAAAAEPFFGATEAFAGGIWKAVFKSGKTDPRRLHVPLVSAIVLISRSEVMCSALSQRFIL